MIHFPPANARRLSLQTMLTIAVCLSAFGCRQSPTNVEAKSSPQSQSAPAKDMATNEGWYYAESKDPVKGTVMRVAELHDQWKSSAAQTPAVLKVFHSGKTYAVSVKVPGVMMDDPPMISFHFDDAHPVREVWLRSDDGDAAFSQAPVAFLKRLSTSQTVAIQYSPEHGLPDTVSFHALGFSPEGFLSNTAAAPLRKHAASRRHRHRGHSHNASPSAGAETQAKAMSMQSPG